MSVFGSQQRTARGLGNLRHKSSVPFFFLDLSVLEASAMIICLHVFKGQTGRLVISTCYGEKSY